MLLKLSPGHVRIVDGAWLAAHLPGKTPALPYIAGIGLGVADLAKTADLLTKNAIPFRREEAPCSSPPPTPAAPSWSSDRRRAEGKLSTPVIPAKAGIQGNS